MATVLLGLYMTSSLLAQRDREREKEREGALESHPPVVGTSVLSAQGPTHKTFNFYCIPIGPISNYSHTGD